MAGRGERSIPLGLEVRCACWRCAGGGVGKTSAVREGELVVDLGLRGERHAVWVETARWGWMGVGGRGGSRVESFCSKIECEDAFERKDLGD
jgi:hypothetical protein